MLELIQPVLNKILFVVLISLRVTGFIFTVPILSSVIFPVRIKIIFIILLSYILSNTLPPVNLLPANISFIVVLGVLEVLTGIFLGISVYFLFLAIQLAGVFIDNEFGTSLMNILDPTTNESMTILSQIYVLLFSIVFVAMDGINMLLLAFKESYKYINIWEFTRINSTPILELFNVMLVKSFVLAAPIIIPSFLATVLMGIASRIVPELNVFITVFPLRIIIGMIILTFSISIFFYYSEFVIDALPIFIKRGVGK